MKIENFSINLEQIEIAIQKRQQQEFKKIDEYSPKIDGYSIFEICKSTGNIKIAELTTNTDYVLGGVNRSKLVIKPNCIYVEALNVKNAVKRLIRGDIIRTT